MSDKTKIEWTDATWNVCTGCSKVSQGCHFCYAERDWKRLSANPKTVYAGRKFTDVQVHPERLGLPLKWKKPRRIFVNSMSDLFHEQIPFEFIASVFCVMSVTTRHTYQILTKRPERMLEFFEWAADGDDPFHEDAEIRRSWPEWLPWKGYDNCGPIYPYENVWLGVSVENQATADERIPLLLDTPAAVRFLSCEPLLGPVTIRGRLEGCGDCDPCIGRRPDQCHAAYHLGALHPEGIHWVITGGESGPMGKARPSHDGWFRNIRDQCQVWGVPYCHKQNGAYLPMEEAKLMFGEKVGPGEPAIDTERRVYPGRFVYVGKKRAGRTLDGETWDQYPE